MHKIIVAITGASGSIYPSLLLNKLFLIKDQWSHLGIVLTDNARLVWQTELGNDDYNKFDAQYFTKNDFMAPFASGSGDYNIMIIVPCSMGTLGRIASGTSGDLITRAADVILKE
ncbi:MAG: 3-octaprenyl-4-hydroxybenzoate carboxy-lyase, partial [Bacteroidota bacterium]|nr:3-octaprenyl-4-hydroxybenzoate carboxy-lyase [Bacteroidota bacterium]